MLPARRLTLPSTLIAIAITSGCTHPSVAVRSATVERSTADAVQVGVELELTNPASDPMRLLEWEYTYTTGSASYRGRWSALATLPPDGLPAVHRIPCVVPASAFDANSPWTLSGQLTFRSPSRVAEALYEVGLIQPSASFSGGGASTQGANGLTVR
ncbi:MAG: hypothetical protein SGJ09_08675 [Phycisphaerae bacterium]|nr:hypothetical protein [Phycisphaerae bacterium]